MYFSLILIRDEEIVLFAILVFLFIMVSLGLITDHIYISPENAFLYPLFLGGPLSTGPVDAYDGELVARLDRVDIGFIGDHSQSAGCLALRNVLRILLQLHILFVNEEAQIVLQLETELAPTSCAIVRLLNPSSLHSHMVLFIAVLTFEARVLHLRNDLPHSDHDPFKHHQLVYVPRS